MNLHLSLEVTLALEIQEVTVQDGEILGGVVPGVEITIVLAIQNHPTMNI